MFAEAGGGFLASRERGECGDRTIDEPGYLGGRSAEVVGKYRERQPLAVSGFHVAGQCPDAAHRSGLGTGDPLGGGSDQAAA